MIPSGNADAALEFYTEALEIRHGLYAADPTSGQAAEDLADLLSSLGDCHHHRGAPGDAEIARAFHSEARKLRGQSEDVEPMKE